jgi:DNA-directed RNA polymerase subunit RPC12/RpoP
MKQITCMYCGEDLPAAAKSIGKTVRCPACNHKMRIRPPAPSKPQPREKDKTTKAAQWEGKSDKEIAEQLLATPLSKVERQRQAIRDSISFLLPRYDDLTLFALAVTVLMLLATNADLREIVTAAVSGGMHSDLVPWLAVAVLGMAFSLFNVFFQREKSDLEKGTMLIFAVGVTAGTAIWASDVMLAQSRGWLLIFPAWNAANGALLLFLFRLGLVDTSCIADLKASLVQIAVTIVSIAILVAVCQYVFRLHVAITFSIAVGYTMSLLGSLRDVFGLHPCDG